MISNQYFCCRITCNINFTPRNILTAFLHLPIKNIHFRALFSHLFRIFANEYKKTRDHKTKKHDDFYKTKP